MNQPKRGRPPEGGRAHSIQKHFFMDEETAAKLRELAQSTDGNESAWLRTIIESEYVDLLKEAL